MVMVQFRFGRRFYVYRKEERKTPRTKVGVLRREEDNILFSEMTEEFWRL